MVAVVIDGPLAAVMLAPGELIETVAHARVHADDYEKPLVDVVATFLLLVAPYVRAGMSAPGMSAAAADATIALRRIADRPAK